MKNNHNKGPANELESSPTGYGFVPVTQDHKKEKNKNGKKQQ